MGIWFIHSLHQPLHHKWGKSTHIMSQLSPNLGFIHSKYTTMTTKSRSRHRRSASSSSTSSSSSSSSSSNSDGGESSDTSQPPNSSPSPPPPYRELPLNTSTPSRAGSPTMRSERKTSEDWTLVENHYVVSFFIFLLPFRVVEGVRSMYDIT